MIFKPVKMQGIFPQHSYFCENPSMKAESLCFSHILASFQIHCNGELRQNFKDCVTVQIPECLLYLVYNPLKTHEPMGNYVVCLDNFLLFFL